MSAQDNPRVQGALSLLSIFLPQVAPLVAGGAKLYDMARDAYKQIGGEDTDFDQMLANIDVKIDRLADPDSFRNKPPEA